MAYTDGKLPIVVKNRILGNINYNHEERDQILNKFTDRFLKLASDDRNAFKNICLTFEKVPCKKAVKLNTETPSKRLTYKARRKLGLYTVGRKSLKYKNLIPLHELWKQYMNDYLNLNELKIQNWKNNPDDPNFESVNQKLYKADFHGSEMEVVRSTCYSLVGISGIVVMETRNSFKLLGKDDIVRTIPKSTCFFRFTLNELIFSFFGKNFLVRPAERSSKKLKKVHTLDL